MPKPKPLVSILLPVYNGECTLKATLESLLAQTHGHFELLIGIDGTQDDSKVIAEAFRDKRIRIIEHPVNLGLANNLNALMGYIAPEAIYIAMAEQDDVYVPERLQWQLEVMRQHPKVGLVSGIAEFVSDTQAKQFPGILVYGQSFPQGVELFKYLYINQLKVVNTCMMFRRATHVNNNLSFRNTYGNFNVDWDYVLRFALISQVYGIPKVLVHMDRSSKRSSVTTNKWGQFRASRQLISDFKNEFPKLVSLTDYKAALKMCRKIELGYRNKWAIVFLGLYYTFLYLDSYFVKYVYARLKQYVRNY
ncbi:glycosyltransferase family 2 protein [Snuella sedimenti]|uniref:Glycosyltransferase family 2 protein n=1 Tax=Snuella sedimenti TaxID=2798802 RepID=A0A8J7LT47_9FLAO|nr:glycosyltransferase family 2 protein [Snuella sedimenti]MBJ6367896.1 glycosyltransferase family 2 protein [Snuella sedimenti]